MTNNIKSDINITHSPENNAAYIKLGEGKYLESEEVLPNIVLDFDETGALVGIELLNANLHLPANLRQVKA